MSRIDPYKESVEDRVVKRSFRQSGKVSWRKQPYLDMSNHDEQEPSEGDRRVHVSEKRFPLPYLGVQQAVAENILDILPGCLRAE